MSPLRQSASFRRPHYGDVLAGVWEDRGDDETPIPELCAVCGAPLDNPGTVCGDCEIEDEPN